MKKTMSKEALLKETAYWNAKKQAVKLNPGAACHK